MVSSADAENEARTHIGGDGNAPKSNLTAEQIASIENLLGPLKFEIGSFSNKGIFTPFGIDSVLSDSPNSITYDSPSNKDASFNRTGTGDWQFTVDGSKLGFLGQNQKLLLTYQIDVIDLDPQGSPLGGQDKHYVTVTIQGSTGKGELSCDDAKELDEHYGDNDYKVRDSLEKIKESISNGDFDKYSRAHGLVVDNSRDSSNKTILENHELNSLREKFGDNIQLSGQKIEIHGDVDVDGANYGLRHGVNRVDSIFDHTSNLKQFDSSYIKDSIGQ